jgi:putative hemolysin
METIDLNSSEPNPWNLKLRLQNIKLSKFRPKIKFEIEVGEFVLKTASCEEELRQVLALRHEVFIEEGLGQTRTGALDFDKYDLLGDHILLIDKKSAEVVGTYRILSTGFCDQVYSAKEFELDEFLSTNSLKLELGRACIKSSFRKGIAIHLIWKGLGRYAALTGADLMFGCTSLKITNKMQAQSVINYLNPDHYSNKFSIRPKFRYQFYYTKRNELRVAQDVENLIPPLLRSYLKAGARVYGKPAYDREFKCTDFLTIIDLKNLPEKYTKKYLQL